MKRHIILIGCLTACSLATVAQTQYHRIDDGWMFRLEGVDSVPHRVDLPHDWSVLFDFDKTNPAGNDGGYAHTGKGTYEKTLRLSKADLKQQHALYFEGVYMNATILVNDSVAGGHPYGYSSFEVDITPYLHSGNNRIVVKVDNSQQPNCRWYSGSGIYRHVYLVKRGDVTLPKEEIFFTTPEVTRQKATIQVQAAVHHAAKVQTPITLRATLRRGTTMVWSNETAISDRQESVQICGEVQQPALWSPEHPELYSLDVELLRNGTSVECYTQEVGIRSIRYSAQEGFLLNDEPINLYGGCVHHDHGVLGARSYDAAEARKVRLLKEAGFNAVRTSHNPPSPAFLAECDKQGLLVVDEAFDGWREQKLPHDYHRLFDTWWKQDVEAMVRRDRNHPSIICWSTGNEVMERKKIEIVTTAHKLAEACRALDATRPVTSALCSWDAEWEIYDPLAAEHDIVGYNYMLFKSESDHERVPSRIMWQTESYPVEAFKSWSKVHDYPYIIGDFVWTAMDYLGEAGIGRHYYEGDKTPGEHYTGPKWPWHGAYCGDIDITGYRKPISHYRTMLFAPSEPVYMAVHEPNGYKGDIRTTLWGTLPTVRSWNWEGYEGDSIEVEVTSHHPGVRLYRDNTLVGQSSTGREEEYKTVFKLPYQPGMLRAVAVNNVGNEVSPADTLYTAGTPTQLRITADREQLTADNQDLAYITIEVLDEKGHPVPHRPIDVHVSATGAGSVIATGSGDMTDEKGYYRTSRTTWQGRAIAVIKSTHRAGDIVVRVTSPGIKDAVIKLKAVKSTLHK